MIVITAAAGQIGSQVLDRLLETNASLRVIVRHADKLPAHIRERVEVVEGSHGDPNVVDRAFRDADQLFWLVPTDDRAPSVYSAYVDFSIPAADAIVRHAVSHVVTISALGRGQQLYGGYASASFAMEDLLRSTGAHVRALTMPSFMDNLLWQVGAMKSHGTFFSPISGQRSMPSVATRDIAHIATRFLLDDGWVGQDSVGVLGPEDLSFDDMAATISDVVGTPIRFQQIAAEDYRDGFLKRGYSQAMAQGMLDMALAKDRGLDNGLPRTTENTTPTTYRRWCEDTLLPAFRAS